MTALKRQTLKLTAPEYRANPWQMFGRLRELGTVTPVRVPFMGKCWGVTTYDAVSEILKDTEHFVRNPKNANRRNFVPMQWMLPRVFFALIHNMMGADHQNHRRLRSLVDKAFAMRNVEGMASRIELLAQEQLEVAARVAERDGRLDLIEHFARPFPLTVICELLGLPLEDRPKFRKWFAPFSTVSSVFGLTKLGRGMRNVSRYLKERIEITRNTAFENTDETDDTGDDGLISQLVRAKHEGEQLSEQELLAMIFLLLVAGHETTVHLISNALLTFLQHPEAQAELMSDWSLSEAAIEEVLRYSSPIQIAKPRYVANDMQYHGQQLKQGELMLPILASANYDPDRFDSPETFNIHRERIYHMTFGSGPHVCLGMKLARSETHFALKTLFDRWPNMTADFDLQNPDWSKRIGMRSMKTLFVRPE